MCKPWNLGRGLEHTVTNNLNQIIRLVDTGPKVSLQFCLGRDTLIANTIVAIPLNVYNQRLGNLVHYFNDTLRIRKSGQLLFPLTLNFQFMHLPLQTFYKI